MNCLTAEIYSWYGYGIDIELNCIMEKFQKSKVSWSLYCIQWSKQNSIDDVSTCDWVWQNRTLNQYRFKDKTCHSYCI